jgi:hypothetical protein
MPHFCRSKVRPDIGATLATCGADEPMLNIGNPQLIGPSGGAHFDRVAASVVGAIDQNAVAAGSSHLAERDFLLPGMSGHGGD